MAKADSLLIISAVALTLFGLLMLASASSVISQDRFGHPYLYLIRQALLGVGGGAIGFLIGHRIAYRRWQTMAALLLLVSLVLMGLVFLPQTGFGYGGAKRWIRIGSFSLQPAELLKLSLIFYLAAWLAKRKKEIRSAMEGPAPFLTVLGVIGVLLALQPDIGTLGVIILTGGAMYFVAGGRLLHMAVIIMLVLAAVAVLIWLAPYRLNRVITFLNPEADPQGIGYQLRQSLIAIGSGGTTGLGIGFSRQKYYYLPEAFGDSIFAIMAEEIGFAGIALFLSMLALLLGRGLMIAKRAPDEFGRLTAVGITSWIGFQSLINMGAVSGLVPFTGVPLPFISYGGTSLALLLTAVGILTNISKSSKIKV
jgi:cell division protein FtsW